MTNSADSDQLASQKPNDLDLHCLLRQACHVQQEKGWNKNMSYLILCITFFQPKSIDFFFFLFLSENLCYGSHKKSLTYNICFHKEIRKIFTLYPILFIAMLTFE